MSEIETFGSINAGGERHEMTTENTYIYQHIGRLALFNHVFVAIGEDSGAYVWNDHSQYPSILEAAASHECPAHLNLREVSEIDERAYYRHHTKDLGDYIPEDWNE